MAKYDRTNYNQTRQKPSLQPGKDNLKGGKNSQEEAKEAGTYLLPQLGDPQNQEANTHKMFMKYLV